MKLSHRVATSAAVAVCGVTLLAGPAQASTLVTYFANSEAGGLFCHAVEGVLEQRRAASEGHAGDWYYCEQTPDRWSLYAR